MKKHTLSVQDASRINEPEFVLVLHPAYSTKFASSTSFYTFTIRGFSLQDKNFTK